MATKFSSTLNGTNGTDADFRAWCTFVHQLLTVTGGWVNTADTGQMDLATVLHPTLVNQKMGYKIYRMNDALQGTAPVYVRLDFGSSAASTYPSMWITIGTGSDGAGTITGILFNGGATAAPTVASSVIASVTRSYGSADSGRVVLAMFIEGSANHPLVWALERTTDASGARTAAGLLMWWKSAYNVALDRGLYIDLNAGATQPPTETGISYALSTSNPSSFGSDIGVAVPIPFRGIAQQPGTQLAIVRGNDFVNEAAFQMTLYGVEHTYQHLNNQQVNTPAAAADANSRLCIQYD